MNLKQLSMAVPVTLFVVASGAASAGQILHEAGAIACVNDKWDETEPHNGPKVVVYAGRCVHIPDDTAAPKHTDECVGSYEYMADGTWKGSGTCTSTFRGGDTMALTWEEGSHLKASTYKITGGAGKYAGVSGEGTYTLENLTETLQGGRYTGQVLWP